MSGAHFFLYVSWDGDHEITDLLMLRWTPGSLLVAAAWENLLWRSRGQQRRRVSRCSHVHCLLPHAGMLGACLCPCVSRQDALNYFAQLPPWTIATARQYTRDAEHTRAHSTEDHSSHPSHTWVPPDTPQTRRNRDGSRLLSAAVASFSDQSVRYPPRDGHLQSLVISGFLITSRPH